MLRWLALGLSLLGVAALAPAAEIVQLEPTRQGPWLQISLQAHSLLDEKTTKTIQSGLPGSCVYRFELLDAEGGVVVQRLLEFALHFDVWEERYILESAGSRTEFASLAAADSAWSAPEGVVLAPLARLAAGEYRVRVEVAVRPIAAADRLRLAEYVRQGASDLQVDVGLLFARWSGDDDAQRERFVGHVFRLEALPEAP